LQLANLQFTMQDKEPASQQINYWLFLIT